jgi:hypothetical protein
LTQQRWHALAPLTGLAFVVFVVIAFIIGGETPDTDDSPQKILDFYRDNDTEQVWASALLAWGTVLFLFFLGVLRSVLRAVEGGMARLSTVAFAGGIVLAVGMLAFAGSVFVLGPSPDKLTPEGAQALNTLNSDFFFPVAAGLGTLMIATALSCIRSRALPAWVAWSALVIGIAALTPAGFFAVLVFLLWTAIVSVLLWRAATAPPVQA